MPRISAFYGIIIYMYRPDHPPPHFHARYGENVAQIRLDTFEVLDGSLPPRALRLVREREALHTIRTIVWPNGLDPSPGLLHDYEPDLVLG